MHFNIVFTEKLYFLIYIYSVLMENFIQPSEVMCEPILNTISETDTILGAFLFVEH